MGEWLRQRAQARQGEEEEHGDRWRCDSLPTGCTRWCGCCSAFNTVLPALYLHAWSLFSNWWLACIWIRGTSRSAWCYWSTTLATEDCGQVSKEGGNREGERCQKE